MTALYSCIHWVVPNSKLNNTTNEIFNPQHVLYATCIYVRWSKFFKYFFYCIGAEPEEKAQPQRDPISFFIFLFFTLFYGSKQAQFLGNYIPIFHILIISFLISA